MSRFALSIPEVAHLPLTLTTQAHHQLMVGLPRLREAVQGTPYSESECVAKFDDILQEMVSQARPDTPAGAVELLSTFLDPYLLTLRMRGGGDIAAFFSDLVEAVARDLPSWDLEAVLRSTHDLGRRLATRMFANSGSALTQGRLGLVCDVNVAYQSSHGTRRSRLGSSALTDERSFMGVTGMLPGAEGGTLSPLLTIRMSHGPTFNRFVHLPFQFVHEYTAHVFATGDSELFNDGWMIHAAVVHLHDMWHEDPAGCGLTQRQGTECGEYVRPVLSPFGYDGYQASTLLHGSLSLSDEGRPAYWRLLHDLASLDGRNGVSHTRCVHLLQRAFDATPQRLRDLLLNGCSLTELLKALET
jgi:hypothetical protein